MQISKRDLKWAIPMPDRVDFKVKITRGKKSTFIMIKGSIYEDMVIINIYVPSNRVPKYMKQKRTELKEERKLNYNSWQPPYLF